MLQGTTRQARLRYLQRDSPHHAPPKEKLTDGPQATFIYLST